MTSDRNMRHTAQSTDFSDQRTLMHTLQERIQKARAENAGSGKIPPKSEPKMPTCDICNGMELLTQTRPEGTHALIPCHCAERKLRSRLPEILKTYANLGPLAKHNFDTFDPTTTLQDKALSYAVKYALNPKGWLVLSGASATGKTHLAAAITNELIARETPTLFMRCRDILDTLRSTYSSDAETTAQNLVSRLIEAPILVIDALDAPNTTPWADDKIDQLIERRHDAELPTVITMTADPSTMPPRIASRLCDDSLSTHLKLSLPESAFKADPPELSVSQTLKNFRTSKHSYRQHQADSLTEAHSAATEFVNRPKGFLTIIGDPGTGKSHLATAIAHALSPKMPVAYLKAQDLIQRLYDALPQQGDSRQNSTYQSLMHQIQTIDILIIDGLSDDGFKGFRKNAVIQIIEYRHDNALPTVITTQTPPERIARALDWRLRDTRNGKQVYLDVPPYYQ